MKHVYLISTPRTNSVAITRVLEQTNLFNIFHEPYVSVYDKVHYVDVVKGWFKDTSFTSDKEVLTSVNKLTSMDTKDNSEKHILIKDMAFAITDYIDGIIKDVCDSRHKETYFILLCRNPMDVLISFYNKCLPFEEVDLLSGNTSCDINVDSWRNLSGFKQLLTLKTKLTQQKCNFMLASTDDLLPCISKIFKFIDIEFKSEYIQWQPCTQDQISVKSEEWRENKKDALFTHWHGEALRSRGIRLNKRHEIHEIEDARCREVIDQLYTELLPLYKELLS